MWQRLLQHQADISFGLTLNPAPDKPFWAGVWQAQHRAGAVVVAIRPRSRAGSQIAARSSRIHGDQGIAHHATAELAVKAVQAALTFPQASP